MAKKKSSGEQVSDNYIVKAVRIGAGYKDTHVRIYLPITISESLGIRHGSLLQIQQVGKQILIKKIADSDQPLEQTGTYS